jgi:hypothetical protein
MNSRDAKVGIKPNRFLPLRRAAVWRKRKSFFSTSPSSLPPSRTRRRRSTKTRPSPSVNFRKLFLLSPGKGSYCFSVANFLVQSNISRWSQEPTLEGNTYCGSWLGNCNKYYFVFKSASYFTVFICKYIVLMSLNRFRICKIWLWEW